jgi:hypothetical protein
VRVKETLDGVHLHAEGGVGLFYGALAKLDHCSEIPSAVEIDQHDAAVLPLQPVTRLDIAM